MLDWLAVSILGLLVGVGDLVLRYLNMSRRALYSWAAFFYIAMHVVSAFLALSLIREFGFTFGLDSQESTITLGIAQVFVAAFGSALFLRSSLFSVSVGNQEVMVGPAYLLLVFRTAVDSHVGRIMAMARMERIARIMEGVSYTQAIKLLPAYCLALAQNAPPEAQKAVHKQVLEIDRSTQDSADSRSRLYLLGMTIANYVGVDVLEEAVSRHRASLMQPGLEDFTLENRVKLARRLGELTSEERAEFTDKVT